MVTWAATRCGRSSISDEPAGFPLKEASILVSDEVVETRKKIVGTKVDSDEWESAVVPQVLKLIDETLPALSSGWGNTLGLTFVMFWLFTVGTMAALLDTDHTITVGSAAVRNTPPEPPLSLHLFARGSSRR